MWRTSHVPWTAVMTREQISTQQHLCSPPQQPWAVDLHAFTFMIALPSAASPSCIARHSPSPGEHVPARGTRTDSPVGYVCLPTAVV